MDLFYVILLISFILGIILVMYSLYNFRGNDSYTYEENDAEEYLTKSIENKIRAMDVSVADADSAINELANISNGVFKEIDNKYEELLFLYNLIDEKKKELAIEEQKINGERNDKTIDIAIDEKINLNIKNEKYYDIIDLKKKGMSIKEISKQLGIGQGEISLILELGKGGK